MFEKGIQSYLINIQFNIRALQNVEKKKTCENH